MGALAGKVRMKSEVIINGHVVSFGERKLKYPEIYCADSKLLCCATL